jgi:hypothetical protein
MIESEREKERKSVPEAMTSLKAFRSEGNLATGLQKLKGWPAQSSTMRVRW